MTTNPDENKPHVFDIDRRRQEAAQEPERKHAPLTIDDPEPPKEDSVIIKPPEIPLSGDEVKEVVSAAKDRGKQAAADMGENFLIPLREGVRSIFKAVLNGLESAGDGARDLRSTKKDRDK